MRWRASWPQLQDEAAGRRGAARCENPRWLFGAWLGGRYPTPSTWARSSGLCAFPLLAWLTGTIHPWALVGCSPGASTHSTPLSPQNSLQWFSTSHLLTVLWTLVARSSLVGKCTASD